MSAPYQKEKARAEALELALLTLLKEELCMEQIAWLWSPLP